MVKQPDLTHQRSVECTLQPLLVQSRNGDNAAYRTFLKKLADYLRLFLRKRLYPFLDDVDDLVQEIVFAVHGKRATYRPEEPLTAWIHAIARYKLADYLRARSRRAALQDSLDAHYEPSCMLDTERTDAERDVETILSCLPHKQRFLIICIKLRGLSIVEAATLTGWSESAIKVGLHRGMKRLTARMRVPQAPRPATATATASSATAVQLPPAS
jgi:RNA polymerase sigma-70 factor, ECF subfamily